MFQDYKVSDITCRTLDLGFPRPGNLHGKGMFPHSSPRKDFSNLSCSDTELTVNQLHRRLNGNWDSTRTTWLIRGFLLS